MKQQYAVLITTPTYNEIFPERPLSENELGTIFNKLYITDNTTFITGVVRGIIRGVIINKTTEEDEDVYKSISVPLTNIKCIIKD